MLALAWLDRAAPAVGLISLLALTATLGMGHGALDALLLLRRFSTARERLAGAAAYLLAVLGSAALLAPWPAVALIVLLLLSIWHFGEGFEPTDGASAASQLLLRLVRGGAPVLLPALLAPAALEPIIHAATGANGTSGAVVFDLWRGLAFGWLALTATAGVAASCGRLRMTAASGTAWIELAALSLLYALLSPLLAFALFFGFYHSTVHIMRVANRSASGLAPASPGWRTALDLLREPCLLATLALTLLLMLLLAGAMRAIVVDAGIAAFALRSVVLGLAAVSLPHVWLITHWAEAHQGPDRAGSTHHPAQNTGSAMLLK